MSMGMAVAWLKWTWAKRSNIPLQTEFLVLSFAAAIFILVQSQARVELLTTEEVKEILSSSISGVRKEQRARRGYDNSSIDTCAFREYPDRRYYHLDAPRSQWPSFLGNGTYIFGEAPLVLTPSSSADGSSAAARSKKLCVDQSSWYPGNGFGSEIHPFSDGSNPSILRIKDNPHLDATFAVELRSMLPPEAHFLVVMCMSKNLCSWGETEEELKEFRLADHNRTMWNYYMAKSKPFLRTTILAVDQSLRTVAQFGMNVVHDAPYDNQKKLYRKKRRKRGHWTTPAELDDPRLFIYNGRIHISYSARVHYMMVHQPLHLEKQDNTILAKIKASETVLPCCGRNMAFLDRGDKDPATNNRPQIVTWLDPLTVEDARNLVVKDPFKDRNPESPGESKPTPGPRSRIHGTTGFVLYVPQTDEYLTIGHFHRPHDNLPSQYSKHGHHYTHAWVAMKWSSESGKYALNRVSPEFVFPSHHRPHDAEIIQFASGLEWMDDETLVVTYGINDCEGAAMILPWSQTHAMLRPVDAQHEIYDAMAPLKYWDQ